MKVRSPKLDFSKVRPHWSPCLEFAQRYNAGSTVPAHIEPYLVKVMVKAKAALDPAEIRLHQDLAIFIKQEMQHCKLHIAFNKRLQSAYPGMIPLEKAYAESYADFLENRSLRFNLAYSEGFEAMSSIAVTAFFEHFDEFLKGADEEVVELWKWHLAEEYEHRIVAHEVYHALYGMNPVFSYFYRVYGFIFAVRHIRAHTNSVADYLLATDREAMSPAEIQQSKECEKRVKKALGRSARFHLRAILSPFYRPEARPLPKGLDAFLALYDLPVMAA